ncbi:MAG TPA: ATPase domain-containing protein, partial [Minicystis sp.]|nr:ATPase domain-containing protein [Minicystis sp.]
MKPAPPARVPTGVSNLDELVGGGLPAGSLCVLAGPPGSGKTILAEQLCFHNAARGLSSLYFNTLSEPTAKTLRYLSVFSFFDRDAFGRTATFADLGGIARASGLQDAADALMQRVHDARPAIVVVDSFKMFDDLARSPAELRTFGYELAVRLMARECTVLLLGEYGEPEYAHNPLFSIVDGLLILSQRRVQGENERYLQIVKLRGTEHS